jgi:hypothetical protein
MQPCPGGIELAIGGPSESVVRDRRASLTYVAAEDLDHAMVDFNHLHVVSTSGEKLGVVDGFVVDIAVVRPHYVVVHAGKWFGSKYVLLPIGHLAFDSVARTLVADVSRDRIAGHPGFDRDEWERISDQEIERFDRVMKSIGAATETPATPTWWDPGR